MVTEVSNEDGIGTFRLGAWTEFYDFLYARILTRESKARFIWRGQRRADWSLSTSLDRLFEKTVVAAGDRDREADNQLDAFKYAARGRRGLNPPKLDANEWWALGQHYGLATPLLDWTRSPFAAAYFAFVDDASDRTEHRVVYGLDQQAVGAKNDEILNAESLEKGRPSVIEFIDPLVDENLRLVSQAGLFTRAPIGVPIETWVATAFESSSVPVLLRIELPDADRLVCLSSLEHMNINHASLFPDLVGACVYVNIRRELGQLNG